MTNQQIFKRYLDEVELNAKIEKEKLLNKLKDEMVQEEALFRKAFGDEININTVIEDGKIKIKITDTEFYVISLVPSSGKWELYKHDGFGVCRYGFVCNLNDLLYHIANNHKFLGKI